MDIKSYSVWVRQVGLGPAEIKTNPAQLKLELGLSLAMPMNSGRKRAGVRFK